MKNSNKTKNKVKIDFEEIIEYPFGSNVKPPRKSVEYCLSKEKNYIKEKSYISRKDFCNKICHCLKTTDVEYNKAFKQANVYFDFYKDIENYKKCFKIID